MSSLPTSRLLLPVTAFFLSIIIVEAATWKMPDDFPFLLGTMFTLWMTTNAGSVFIAWRCVLCQEWSVPVIVNGISWGSAQSTSAVGSQGWRLRLFAHMLLSLSRGEVKPLDLYPSSARSLFYPLCTPRRTVAAFSVIDKLINNLGSPDGLEGF